MLSSALLHSFLVSPLCPGPEHHPEAVESHPGGAVASVRSHREPLHIELPDLPHGGREDCQSALRAGACLEEDGSLFKTAAAACRGRESDNGFKFKLRLPPLAPPSLSLATKSLCDLGTLLCLHLLPCAHRGGAEGHPSS
jgi:hypothetical protein